MHAVARHSHFTPKHDKLCREIGNTAHMMGIDVRYEQKLHPNAEGVAGDIEMILGGRRVLLDTTVVMPAAKTYASRAAKETGWAIAYKEGLKLDKYQEDLRITNENPFSPPTDFIPLVVEAYGGWSDTALKFFRYLCQMRSHRPGVATRTDRFLLQHLLVRLDVILQSYNADAILSRSRGVTLGDTFVF